MPSQRIASLGVPVELLALEHGIEDPEVVS
jgi:hypothetical protein